jgi:hypothetical protein
VVLFESGKGRILKPLLRRTPLLAVVCAIVLIGCSSDDSPTRSTTGTWALQTSGTTEDLHAIWGTGPDDVFAVGGAGTILHFDGTSWAPQTSNTTQYLWGISGTSDSDIYAVGSGGTILHYDGNEWQNIPSPVTRIITGVVAIAPNNVYAVGESGLLLHFDGLAWTGLTVGTSGFLTSITAGKWSIHPAVDAQFEVVVILAAGGKLFFNNSSRWSQLPLGFYPTANDVWIAPLSELFVVAGDKILRGGMSPWTIATSPSANALQAIHGPSVSDLFAVGKGMIHFDGNEWSTVLIPTSSDLYDVWVNSTDCGFAVGKAGTILRLQR